MIESQKQENPNLFYVSCAEKVNMATLKQIGIAIIGIAIGGGFAFGGIASYSGMVDSGQNNQQQEFNASMPSDNYQEAAFDLSAQEQKVLAYNNRAVFVNAFYDNQSQKQDMTQLQDISSDFSGRVYVSLANSTSDSDILYSYGLTEFPAVVVIGGQPERQPQILRDSDSQQVSREICNAFRQLGSAASQCFN